MKRRSRRLQEAHDRHEKWLASLGITKRSTLKGVDHVNLKEGIKENTQLTNGISGNGTKKDAKTYTGDYVKGIATMHKSNAIPVTSGEQAIEVAQMRRN